MTEHELSIKASANVFQRMTLEQGAFEILEETVLRRVNARSVECSCGETFDRGGWEVRDAKDHLKNAAWEDENLGVSETPLRVGDTIDIVGDDRMFEVKTLRGDEIEVHLNSGILPIRDRGEFRESIKASIEDGVGLEITDSDGNEKSPWPEADMAA